MTTARGELIPLDKQWRTLLHSRVNSHIRRMLEVQRSVCRPCFQTAGKSCSSVLAAGLGKRSHPFLVLVRFIEAHSHNQKMLKMTVKEKVTCLENEKTTHTKANTNQ